MSSGFVCCMCGSVCEFCKEHAAHAVHFLFDIRRRTCHRRASSHRNFRRDRSALFGRAVVTTATISVPQRSWLSRCVPRERRHNHESTDQHRSRLGHAASGAPQSTSSTHRCRDLAPASRLVWRKQHPRHSFINLAAPRPQHLRHRGRNDCGVTIALEQLANPLGGGAGHVGRSEAPHATTLVE